MKGSNLFTWNNNVCSDDCWKKAKDHNNTQINNNIFVGSSKDLLELIEQKSKA